MAQHAVILTPEEYEKLKEAAEVLTEIFQMTLPSPDLNVAETVAIAFQAEFDPSRTDEWGHVSYCFNKALRMALRVAGQEARKRAA